MKIITKNTDYAITALCALARQGEQTVAVSALARDLNISHAFLRKLFQVLEKKGVLNSRRGKGGGFSLARSAGQISLRQIMEIFQGPLAVGACFIREKVCPHTKHCLLRGKLMTIERSLASELTSLTIASLLE